MRKRAFLIMIAILALLSAAVYSSSAQDIDILNMNNAQLMALLQAIMQKLEEETEENSPEALNVTTVPAIEDTPEPVDEANSFRIYGNKKLVVEQIPDWYFIRDEPTEKSPESPAKKKPTASPDGCIICARTDPETGEGLDCFSIC